MKSVLLCLHGWGGSKESFTELREALKGSALEILTPDLPGFGDEPEPDRPWTTDDYADWVREWITDRGCTDRRIHLLGHSHGGRIAIKLLTRSPKSEVRSSTAHLYLCAAAGIRHPRHFRRMIGLTLAKSGKFLLSIPGMRILQPIGKKLLYKLVRVHDYEQASPVMRQTLINVTKEDFRPLLSKIDIPTDIFWGEDDRMTPISDGIFMHRQIKGSTFHRYAGVRHRVHRDKAEEIARVVLRSL